MTPSLHDLTIGGRQRKLSGLIRELQFLIEGTPDGGEKDSLVEANECLAEALSLMESARELAGSLTTSEPLSFPRQSEVLAQTDSASSLGAPFDE
ncbi:MAG TPA: hypothetical protein VKX49_12910 [Bryobacteraceae bacterium]|nr:hypothetical protein [Bryobacteraceae bacterium]